MKPMKVKVFPNTTNTKLEESIQKWLVDNPQAYIKFVVSSMSGNVWDTTLTILYTEGEE